jgi:hypothetical protein
MNENTSTIPKLKISRSADEIFESDKCKELIIFRLKLWNRSASELFDLVLRVYDPDNKEMVAAYPIAMSFKSRRLRNDTEVFTPFKNEFKIPAYVKRIYFKLEPIKLESFPDFRTDFELKFDLF